MKKIKNWIIMIFTIIFLIGIIYAIINIILYIISNNKNEQIKIEINKVIIEENDKDNDKENNNSNYLLDFTSLKKFNSDTVGYLKVYGTNIDYVIVKGRDNSYYLNHNFNKEYNIFGWPFADYRNKFDGNDKNIIIYGHNVKTGSMFGTLKKVLNSDWQNNTDNRKIVFITENEKSIYYVFSTYVISPENYYVNTVFENNYDYQTFLNTIKERSNYNYNINVSENDTILTLSSCTELGTKRVVLHAKKILSEVEK